MYFPTEIYLNMIIGNLQKKPISISQLKRTHESLEPK